MRLKDLKLRKLKGQTLYHFVSQCWVGVLWLSCALSSVSRAQEAEHLPRHSDVEVEVVAWVGEPTSDSGSQVLRKQWMPQFSVNEQIILNIEVATPRWFTGGTRIGRVEIQNVIAKQRNQLATNYTERKGGQTWSRQRWEITLYPQVSGTFIIPPIAVDVSVSASDGSKVSGTLYTQPISFEAVIPSGLLNQSLPWFSATSVNIQQQWQMSAENLKAGDTITRKVIINAQDSLSVLLPDLLTNESTSHYRVYPQPDRFDDKQVRGDYQSGRIEESVYVIQQGGEFTLPSYQLQWWNSNTKQLQYEVIEGKTFQARHTAKSFLKAYSVWLINLAVMLMVLAVVITAVRRYFRCHPIPAWFTLRQLLKAQRWGEVRAMLYRQLRINTGQPEMSQADGDENWLEQSARLQQGEKDIRLMKQIWRAIQRKRPKRLKLKVSKALPQLDDT